jgi:hypothetical protein
MPELGPALRDLIERSVAPVDVDAIVRTRRRRRARRRVGSAAIVMVIAIVVTGGVLARPTHEPKTLSVRPGPNVSESAATRAALERLTILSPLHVYSNTGNNAPVGSVNVTDPSSGVTRRVAFPIPNLAEEISIVRGSNIVSVLGQPRDEHPAPQGRAYVISSSLDQWRSIGPAWSLFPSVDPGRVWLESSADPRGGDAEIVTEVSLDGTYRSPSYTLPNGRSVVAAVRGGLLTYDDEIWDPASNRVVRRFPLPAHAGLVAADADHIAWFPSDCDPRLSVCPQHLLDLRTGREREIAVPTGMKWDFDSEFSPDGRFFAAVARVKGTRVSVVSITDLATGTAAQYPVSTSASDSSPTWAPDGSVLFLRWDAKHVIYLNPDYPHGPVRRLAVPDADAFFVAEKPAPVDATQQRYEYDGRVAQTAHHSVELCIYATTAIGGPDADDCAGPLVAGWTSSKTSGDFDLVGTYDGKVFTLTEPPRASGPISPGAGRPTIDSPCETPSGGWQPSNPALVTLQAYEAVMDAARTAPDFAGLWMGPNAFAGGVTDLSHSVINVAYTGNLDAHRLTLAALWGGPICVVQHPRSYAELQRVSQELLGTAGKQMGLQLLSVGPDDVNDIVHAEVVAATAATRRAVDARFGRGVVDLVPSLRAMPASGG